MSRIIINYFVLFGNLLIIIIGLIFFVIIIKNNINKSKVIVLYLLLNILPIFFFIFFNSFYVNYKIASPDTDNILFSFNLLLDNVFDKYSIILVEVLLYYLISKLWGKRFTNYKLLLFIIILITWIYFFKTSSYFTFNYEYVIQDPKEYFLYNFGLNSTLIQIIASAIMIGKNIESLKQ